MIAKRKDRIKLEDIKGLSRMDLALIYLTVWGKVHRSRAVSRIALAVLFFPNPVPELRR